MKRSDAVKLIHEIISSELKTTEEFNLKDCDRLLLKLEEAGMEPPSVSKEKWIDCGDGQGYTSYGENYWEDEDEV